MADEPKQVAIRFTQKQTPYNAGEVAGFTPEVAKKYVDGGVAEFFKGGEVVLSVEETILAAGSEKPTDGVDAGQPTPAVQPKPVLGPDGEPAKAEGGDAAKPEGEESSGGAEGAAGSKKAGSKK